MKFFPFTSVHHWGENPIGTWTLQVECLAEEYSEYRDDDSDQSATEISYFALHFYGTYRLEDKLESNSRKRAVPSRRAFVPEQKEIEYMYARELKARNSPDVMSKREFRRVLDQRRAHQRRDDDAGQLNSTYGKFKSAFNL